MWCGRRGKPFDVIDCSAAEYAGLLAARGLPAP
jgi:hypothetical protein